MEIWEEYPNLTKAIRKTHKEAGERFYGHDFDHALRVAICCERISPNKASGRIASIAGLCHNADRIWQKKMNIGESGHVPKKIIREMVLSWLNTENKTITTQVKKQVIDIVIKHSEINKEDDSLPLVILKDADRMVNIEADILLRQGQFSVNLPVIDPYKLLNDPKATYHDPKSLLRLMQELLDWEKKGGFVGIRLPKGRKLAKKRFTFLKLYIKTVIEQRKESGLIPYPTFL